MGREIFFENKILIWKIQSATFYKLYEDFSENFFFFSESRGLGQSNISFKECFISVCPSIARHHEN